MLRLSNDFNNKDILSLRNGATVGFAVTPLINPNNLKIEGWYARNSYEKGDFILPTGEVREAITKGLVVNDHEALTPPEDLVRLKDVISIRFELIGKAVVTESKRRLGKVADYAVDDASYYIQKMYVDPPVLRSLTSQQILIDRTQIIEITDKKIIVQDLNVSARSESPATAQA